MPKPYKTKLVILASVAACMLPTVGVADPSLRDLQMQMDDMQRQMQMMQIPMDVLMQQQMQQDEQRQQQQLQRQIISFCKNDSICVKQQQQQFEQILQQYQMGNTTIKATKHIKKKHKKRTLGTSSEVSPSDQNNGHTTQSDIDKFFGRTP